MSEVQIRRRLRTANITIATAVSESTTLAFDDVAGGVLFVSDLHTAVTTFNVYGARDDASYRPLYDAAGQAVSIAISRLSGTAVETVGTNTVQITVYTAQPAAYALPDDAYPLRHIRIVSNAPVGESAAIVAAMKS
jgi:hypothetical protein